MSDFISGLLVALGVMGGIAGGLAAYIYRKKNGSAKIRMLTQQYQIMTDSADHGVPMDLLARPELISSRMEFRKIEAIEAELLNDTDSGLAKKLLNAFLQGDDPWVRARAAKALQRLDPAATFTELKALVGNRSTFVQLPGIWALGEIATRQALDILRPLLKSADEQIQQAVIRSLVQMEAKRQMPAEGITQVRQMLRELRFKADWIF